MKYPHRPLAPATARLPLAAALTALMAAAPSAEAAIRTWDGNGSSSNWAFVDHALQNGNTNWTDNSLIPLPNSGDALQFQGTNNLNSVNDLTGLTLTGINFLSGAGAFTLNGNAITSAGNISNASSQRQTINLPITLGSNQTWAGNGDAAKLSFTGTLDLGNHNLNLKYADIVNSDSSFTVGNSASAAMTLLDGATVSAVNGRLGASSGVTGTLTVNGAGAAWTNSSDFQIGTSGTGVLNINHGSVADVNGILGVNSGSTGTALVDGLHSSWSNSNDVRVGQSGSGTLTIQNGGSVNGLFGYVGTYGGSDGTVTVYGAGSSWTTGNLLFIGYSGSGNLTLSHGGVVNDDYGYLGSYNGGAGTATVDGIGSSWNNGHDLTVGFSGTGTLSILHGGAANGRTGYIGYSASSNGSVLVDGTGSSWTSNLYLYGGIYGVGSLTVSHGGLVGDFQGYLGNFYGSTGVAVVDGAGSAWANDDSLTVGKSGNGSLTIRNGGVVSNTMGYLGSDTYSEGNATVDGTGSQWINSQGLTVGSQGTGRLTIQNGGEVRVNGPLGVGAHGSLTLNGGALSLGYGSSLTEGGTFDWIAGTVTASTLNLGAAGNLFGDALTLDSRHILTILDDATVTENGFLNVSGVDFTPGGALNNDGILSIGANRTANPGGSMTNTGTVIDRGRLQAAIINNPGTIQLAGSGRIAATQLNLQGGNISGTALDMSAIGTLGGYGTVSSAVSGGSAANLIQASGGTLSLGNLNSQAGFNYAGRLEVGSNQVVLLDKAQAQLGVSTTLADGGRLATLNGANLGAGETLAYAGNASIQGGFSNNGQISGSGSLVFLNDVTGGGGFGGNIHFQASYSPGNSPASVDFHSGDAHFDPGASLAMEIFGTTPGTQYDQLTGIHLLDFNGSLALIFGNGFAPATGDSFSLFNFALFSGAFDPAKISVTGFDPTRLDFSQLGIDGSLRVVDAAPVPLPPALWLFGSALAALAVPGRRKQSA